MIIERHKHNPILVPDNAQSWEAEAVFNGCPVKKGKNIFLLYRALSKPHYHTSARMQLMISDIGIARSTDGIHFSDRKRFIIPQYPWERYGCEDPRVTKLNGKYYTFYTALSAYPFRAEGIKVGLAISNNLEHIEKKRLITPFNAKGMALFPELIDGKMWSVLTVNTDNPPAHICLAQFDKEEDMWSEKRWQKWHKEFEKHSLNLQRRSQDQVEVGAPPIKTKYGWLLFYSYIQNYFSSDKKVFGVEAVLLDLKDPRTIIGRTNAPLLVAEEYYERRGPVPNIVFPSGAMVKGDTAYLYYGAADGTCALAYVFLPDLLKKLTGTHTPPPQFRRAKENPILVANKNNAWEARAVYNPAAISLGGKVHILYRGQSFDNTSVLGYAASTDGVHVETRSQKPAYVPRESFEQKLVPNGNSGCEDPRLTKIGNTIYMFYTAFDGRNPPRVALTKIKAADFVKQKWDWEKPILISPPGIDDKDACLFPEKVKGKYLIIHRVGDDIDLSSHTRLLFGTDEWLEEYRWIAPRKGMWDSRKVGIASPPIKTKAGWLILYHGVSDEDRFYRVGAILADLSDPTKILSRTDEPVFEPETDYELHGQIPNVVFPCGAVEMDKKILIYYGGADEVVGVAELEIDSLIASCRACKV